MLYNKQVQSYNVGINRHPYTLRLDLCIPGLSTDIWSTIHVENLRRADCIIKREVKDKKISAGKLLFKI